MAKRKCSLSIFSRMYFHRVTYYFTLNAGKHVCRGKFETRGLFYLCRFVSPVARTEYSLYENERPEQHYQQWKHHKMGPGKAWDIDENKILACTCTNASKASAAFNDQRSSYYTKLCTTASPRRFPTYARGWRESTGVNLESRQQPVYRREKVLQHASCSTGMWPDRCDRRHRFDDGWSRACRHDQRH